MTDANGNVIASDVQGSLSVDTRFGLVRAERIRGSVDVDNQNGSVTLNDVDGNATVSTSFSSVFLQNVGGAIDIRNQNGAISVAGVRQPCHDLTLRTSFSSITMRPPSFVNPRTSVGTIPWDPMSLPKIAAPRVYPRSCAHTAIA